ncbi:MAG TPA: arabinan endo-1,5-alpha-L-arabinosidase [Abditibacteriaceae bacterium]|jgi:arabinan endo-1,5-alpha-L-arabinosidase
MTNVHHPLKTSGRILEFSGEVPRVHDPVLAKEGNTYYLFSTGPGITVHTSRDMQSWERQDSVFTQPVPWAAETISGSRFHYWAPDIFFLNNRWHLYYSVSTFGRNHSAIGLATSPALSECHWRDEGVAIISSPEDDWNAIDSNLALDETNQLWMAIGSFWSGIKLLRLDSSTGKPAKDAALISIASRPLSEGIHGSIEGASIIRRGKFYYLFVSFDFCCRGILSTYNIRIGRSSSITGPYLDRDGRAMNDGGGSLLLSGSGRWIGPGHNSIYSEDGTDWLIYHAYDAEDSGLSKLRIEELLWDGGAWPYASSMPPILSQ